MAEELARKRESEQVLLKVESGLQEMTLPVKAPVSTSTPDQPDQPPQNITVLVEELERIESHTWITWIETTRQELTALVKSPDPEVISFYYGQLLINNLHSEIFRFVKKLNKNWQSCQKLKQI